MSDDPRADVQTALERLRRAGLGKPASSSVRAWLAALADREVIDRELAAEVTAAYEAARFGGAAAAGDWERIAGELDGAVERFEGLGDRSAIVEALLPDPTTPPPRSRSNTGSPRRCCTATFFGLPAGQP